MLTGLHAESYGSMQLGAGVFLKGLDPDQAADAGALKQQIAEMIRTRQGVIGATQGGGKFQCTPKMRMLGADGQRGPTRGGMVIDSWTVSMSGTMVEITPENFAMALTTADVERSGSRAAVRVRTMLSDEDYISRLCWVGDTPKGLVLIELTDVLNVGGAAFTFGDEREGTLPFRLQAHHAQPGSQDTLPCRIIFFEEAQA